MVFVVFFFFQLFTFSHFLRIDVLFLFLPGSESFFFFFFFKLHGRTKQSSPRRSTAARSSACLLAMGFAAKESENPR